MKSNLTLAIAAVFASASATFAQTQSPKEILKQIDTFETNAYQQARKSGDSGVYRKIFDQAHQMIVDALKTVDPTKVDPKDAYDWAQLYSRIEDHKTVCVLTHAYLTTNPSPEDKFKDQMLMMRSCNALGEADMLKQTLTSTKPVTRQDKTEFGYSATDFVDTIAGKLGDKEGLKLLTKLQRQLVLADPAVTAKERLAAEKAAPANPSDDATASKPALTDDEKLKKYEDQAKSTNQGIEFQFVAEKAKLLQDEGKKSAALAALNDFGKANPDLPTGVKHQFEMTTAQLTVTGSTAPVLKVDKTVGDFSGLDALKGKVVLVDFFAHWCGPCMASVPSMVSMYGELKPKGLEIVGVTSYYGFFGSDKSLPQDQEFAKLQGLLAEKNMSWPIVVGPKDNSTAYGVWGIPESVLIDKKGVVRKIYVGYTPAQEEVVKSAIEDLLKE